MEQSGSTVASSAHQTSRFGQNEVKDKVTGIFSGTSPTEAYRAVGIRTLEWLSGLGTDIFRHDNLPSKYMSTLKGTPSLYVLSEVFTINAG